MTIASNTLPAEVLVDAAARILESVGVPAAGAVRVARNLVTADLRGVETHGLIRLRPYVERIEAGGIAADPEIAVVRDHPATALLDGGNGLGAVAASAAMELAMGKAAASGVGLVVVRNINHFGAAADYSLAAAEQGMIGLSATNVLALIAPTGAAVPMVGNNPLSFAFPGDPPVVYDSAMSVSTWGRVLVAAQRGEPLPADAFLDGDGRPTTDPAAVLDGGTLLPVAGYKGYGLALCVTLLTGVLAGWLSDAELTGHRPHEPGGNTALLGAIDVGAFTDPAEYARRVDRIGAEIRTAPRRPGVDRVWLPGEKETERERERREHGVPLADPVRADLAALAARLGVEIDARLR
ncbi:Ldh family oxidoreductase [Actinomadura decatromicini]|nr:Ldh family oxidoreductase [Actinomadura decatromicini]